MSRYNTFAINRPVLKKLYLRISSELNHVENYRQAVENAALIFAPYFAEVEVLFASEQEKIIDKLKQIHPVVSLDKEISGTYHLDVSRVYCSKTQKYLEHYINPHNEVNTPFGVEVILYDHDIVRGYQFNKIKKELEDRDCIVHPFTFVKANKETEEVLDLRDFLLSDFVFFKNSTTQCGLLIKKLDLSENFHFLARVSYLHDCVDFEARTSIPLSARNTIRTQINSFKNTYGIKL